MIDRNLFHELWTRAVGAPGYVKAEWRELERQIETANRELESRKENNNG